MRSLRCRWLTREPPPRHPFLTPGGIIIANTWSFLMERAGIEMVITSFENSDIFQKFWSNANCKERLFTLWRMFLKTAVEYTLLACYDVIWYILYIFAGQPSFALLNVQICICWRYTWEKTTSEHKRQGGGDVSDGHLGRTGGHHD